MLVATVTVKELWHLIVQYPAAATVVLQVGDRVVALDDIVFIDATDLDPTGATSMVFLQDRELVESN